MSDMNQAGNPSGSGQTPEQPVPPIDDQSMLSDQIPELPPPPIRIVPEAPPEPPVPPTGAIPDVPVPPEAAAAPLVPPPPPVSNDVPPPGAVSSDVPPVHNDVQVPPDVVAAVPLVPPPPPVSNDVPLPPGAVSEDVPPPPPISNDVPPPPEAACNDIPPHPGPVQNDVPPPPGSVPNDVPPPPPGPFPNDVSPPQPGVLPGGMPQSPELPPQGLPPQPGAIPNNVPPYPGPEGSPFKPPKKRKIWPFILTGGILLLVIALVSVFFLVIRPYQIAMEEATTDFNRAVVDFTAAKQDLKTQIAEGQKILDSSVADDYVTPGIYEDLQKEVTAAEAMNYQVPEIATKLDEITAQIVEIDKATSSYRTKITDIEDTAGRLYRVDLLITLAVAQINARAPITVDKETRFDSAEILANRTIRMNYTLVSRRVGDYTPGSVKNVRDLLRKDMVSEIKTDESMVTLKEVNVTFQFRYVGKDGKEFFNFSIGPSDYK